MLATPDFGEELTEQLALGQVEVTSARGDWIQIGSNALQRNAVSDG